MKDLKIVGGLVPDFDKNELVQKDVLIHAGKIEKLGCITEDTKETINADGLIVSPGFINIHAHEDPFSEGFFTAECELRQGITTEIVGNCGETYNPMDEFTAKVNAGAPNNVMSFIGQNTLRQMAGATDRYKGSTRAQLDREKQLYAEMTQKYGTCGLSCGFEYNPGVTTEETIELINVLDGPGYVTSVHFRSDGPDSVKSTEELVEISKATGKAMQMSHIGSCSAVGVMKETLAVIDRARAEGIDIMSDCYPYTAFCTGIGTAVFDEQAFEKWNYSDIMLADGEYKNTRCTKELFEKVRKEHPEYYVVAFVMNEDEIDMAYQKPYVMVGSDGGYLNRGGHPRGSGSFPRVFARFVRERKAIAFMDALKKMTLLPAERMNLFEKGRIQEGCDADIVIFDRDRITDCATFTEPTLAPSGIERIIIGGKTAVVNGVITNAALGSFLRYKP